MAGSQLWVRVGSFFFRCCQPSFVGFCGSAWRVTRQHPRLFGVSVSRSWVLDCGSVSVSFLSHNKSSSCGSVALCKQPDPLSVDWS